jgi:hypothetical protein
MKVCDAIAMLKDQLQIGEKESPVDPSMGACDVTIDVDFDGNISASATGITVRVLLNHWPPLDEKSG